MCLGQVMAHQNKYLIHFKAYSEQSRIFKKEVFCENSQETENWVRKLKIKTQKKQNLKTET